MSTETKKEPATDKKRTSRSPAYPVFSLSEAVARVRKLWDAQRKHHSPVESALSAMGYSSKNGASLRSLAALGHYGLTQDIGNGDTRRIVVSERAQDILLLPESDPRYRKALADSALEPTIHRELWERYGAALPEDSAIQPFLTRDKSYNESSVLEVIKNYRESFEFAKLGTLSEDNLTEQNKRELSDSPAFQPATPQKGNTTMTQDTLNQEMPVLVGARIARVPFPMTEEDFDLFISTLQLWKKKLTKAVSNSGATGNFPAPPFAAMWKNGHFDKMVKIVGLMGEKDGKKFYQSEDGTGIPAEELFPGKQ